MEVSFQKTVAPEAPVIDVQATVTPAAPAPAAPAAPAPAAPAAPAPAAPVAPVAPTPVVDATPAASIPTAPVTAVVPAAPQAVVVSNPVGIDDDNIGFEDVILPRINIVQRVGDMSKIYNPGEIVLNQSQVIHEPAFIHPTDPAQNRAGTGPLIVTVLGFRPRQFTEKVSGGKLGMLLNHEADIEKHNGTLDYKTWQASVEAAKVPGGAPAKRLFQRLATAVVLIQKPAGLQDEDHVLFPYECEGIWYAIALWSMKGTAYTHAAKIMFTARKMGHLRLTGYIGSSWSLTSKLEDFGENAAFIPVVKPASKTTEAFRAFAKDIVSGGK